MEALENALEAPKEGHKPLLRYFARYGTAKPQICCIKAVKYIPIYERRRFVEISHEEFERLIPIVKGLA